jgi:hypothetical protein
MATFKAAQLAAIGYGMAQAVASLFPDLWDSLTDREKATKWIIPLPGPTVDRFGNKRHAYIAIPKDQFQQGFAAIGQSMVDGIRGKPWSPQLMTAIGSMFPVEMASIQPPVYNAYAAYFGNYDTWTKEDVWIGYKNISPSKEQSWKTPEIAKDVTDLAAQAGIEISPERLAAATSKVVPTSNPVGVLLAEAYAHANANAELNYTAVEKARSIPGVRRLLRYTRPVNVQPRTAEEARRMNVDTKGMTDVDAQRAVREADRAVSDVRQPLNAQLDEWMKTGVRSRAEIYRKIYSLTPNIEERKRLIQRAGLRSKTNPDARGGPQGPRGPQRP